MNDPTMDEEGNEVSDVVSLGIRTGLPKELLFLTERHPRATWSEEPGLAGTGDIWLANHDNFRAITMEIAEGLTKLREEAETTDDSAPSFRCHSSNLLRLLRQHLADEEDLVMSLIIERARRSRIQLTPWARVNSNIVESNFCRSLQ